MLELIHLQHCRVCITNFVETANSCPAAGRANYWPLGSLISPLNSSESYYVLKPIHILRLVDISLQSVHLFLTGPAIKL